MPLPGSAFPFLVVLHLPAALELRRAGFGLDVCNRWTGELDWSTGLKYWTGVLEHWSTGVHY